MYDTTDMNSKMFKRKRRGGRKRERERATSISFVRTYTFTTYVFVNVVIQLHQPKFNLYQNDERRWRCICIRRILHCVLINKFYFLFLYKYIRTYIDLIHSFILQRERERTKTNE